MTNVFQPGVFQPNVFQVGTLDVAIPDVPTKRRKWLSLSVPGSGRAGGVSAFAVSRDSAGILIGVRDKAAPQFAVSRDAEGLLLSAWPAKAPLLTSYVASVYALNLSAADPNFYFRVLYQSVEGYDLGTVAVQIHPSKTDWQRFSAAAVIPGGAVSVQVEIVCPVFTDVSAYWTAVQLEGGTEPTAYKDGGANLLLNPKFEADMDDWFAYYDESAPLNATRYSRAVSLPSSPLPGITTALKYYAYTQQAGVYAHAISGVYTLPTP